MSVRLKLTLSYAASVVVVGALLLAVVWVFLLRYVPNFAVPDAPPPGPTRDELVQAFAPPAAWTLGSLVVLGLVGGWFLAGWMLAPLRRITAATQAATKGSLSHRIELPGRHDEFRELADSFDAMLGRIEDQVCEQQRFAANASHELRTPLTTTQALLEVARNDATIDCSELVERLWAVNVRAIALTEALLLLSRADQRAFARQNVDVSLLAEEAAEVLLPLAEERGISISTSGDGATAIGSPALLLQLTINLVHNAIVHNLPTDGIVKVTTSTTHSSVTLTVQNSGTSMSASAIALLTEPFHRGATRLRNDHGGVGLGLAIVKSITRAHDGTLRLAAPADGGLLVTVELPRSNAATGDTVVPSP